MILIYAVFKKIVASVPGWPTLVVMISFFSEYSPLDRRTGEYVGRAFIQTKQRPKYIIEKIIEQFIKRK